jgi:amidase
MKRVTRDLTVPPHVRHKVRQPSTEVELGEAFVVETINFRTPIIRTPQDANPTKYLEREETGPVFVKGVKPGDVLAIEILDIRPEGHASGGWWDDPKVASFLEISDNRVIFPGGLATQVRMMIGDVRLQPADDNTKANPWDYGGNMDFKDICAGNTLCLKAELPGGLLVLGDLHAAQGDGEMLGLAAECAGEVTLRVTKDTRFLSDRPLVVKKDSFVCIACRAGDYAAARDLAVADATKVLARVVGCTEKEAYLYVTTVGDLRNGGVWAMGRKEEWCRDVPLVVGVEVPVPK